jgi:hypothetical protein
LGLGNKVIPKSQWEAGMCSAENHHKVVFKGLDCSLGGKPSMHMRRGKLKINVFVANGFAERSVGFVVQALEERFAAPVEEVLMELIVGSHNFFVPTIVNGLGENCITVIVVQ